jgi:2-succinyl-6-hydroxy-2,4-cyclohexadiene-1-carboxylate synthase
LATDHELVLVDAPGHGESANDDADLVEAARLLVETGGPAHYLGYSMGARILLHAALDHPELVKSLVLIGATPGIDDPEARAARFRSDAELARELEADGLPAFIDRWLAMPMFAGLSDENRHRSARLQNRPEGLAASLRRCGTGAQEPLWDRLVDIKTPTKLIVGESDQKFVAVAGRMVHSMPKANVAVVAGAGHAAHLEAPDAVADIVVEFSRTTGVS